MNENILYHGDNRTFMKALSEDDSLRGKIQMIYIDPPFFSKSNYDAVVKAGNENIKHLAYADKWEKGISEYLKMLACRLYQMKDLLSDTGLIWLHLDWHVSHYAKILMDEIFGEKNFVNEIVWNYKSGGTSKKHFSRKHDTILVYSKTSKYKFFTLQEKSYNRQFKPYRFKGVKEYKDELGWYTMVNMKDVWNIDMVGRTSSERTGYATQKPEALIERIIDSCTEEGDICADFFCGSGTLAAVASRKKRSFICCDKGELAVESTISRLENQGETFSVYEEKLRKTSNLSAKVEVSYEEIPCSDQRLLTVEITGIKMKKLATNIDEKSMDIVKLILKEEPLKLIQSWSIDFDHCDGIHRPEVVYNRNKDNFHLKHEKICSQVGSICIKIVDIFGNISYEIIEDVNRK